MAYPFVYLTFRVLRIKKILLSRAWRRLVQWQCTAEEKNVPAVKAWLSTFPAFCIRPVTSRINLRGLLSAAMKIESVWPELPRDRKSIFAPRRAVSRRISRGFTDP